MLRVHARVVEWTLKTDGVCYKLRRTEMPKVLNIDTKTIVESNIMNTGSQLKYTKNI